MKITVSSSCKGQALQDAYKEIGQRFEAFKSEGGEYRGPYALCVYCWPVRLNPGDELWCCDTDHAWGEKA